MKKLVSITALALTGVWVFLSMSAEVVRASENSEVKNSMNNVQAEVSINAPIEKVWSIIGENFDQNSRFNVDAKKTYYLEEVEGYIGSKRRTVNYKGKIIDVEIIEYEPAAWHVKWEIFNMNVAPLKAGNASYTLHKDGKGGTVLVQKAAFKMKIFFMDWVAKGKFTTMFKRELAAIKHLAETGECITPQTKKSIVERYAQAIKILKY